MLALIKGLVYMLVCYFSGIYKEKVIKVKVLVTRSCPTLCDPSDCIVNQAPLSMEFSRQEDWSGLPFPTPGDFCNPGIEHEPLGSPALAGRFLTTSATWEALTSSILPFRCEFCNLHIVS